MSRRINFAGLAGLNRVYLDRIETGRQSMALRTLKIIADAREVKMRDLIGNLLNYHTKGLVLPHIWVIEIHTGPFQICSKASSIC